MISLILTIAIIALVVGLINRTGLMPSWGVQTINVLAIICVILLILRFFGVVGHHPVLVN